MRLWKALGCALCLIVLASNLWSMRDWTERTGVYDDICYLRQAHLFDRFGIGGFDTDISRDDDQYFAKLAREIGIPASNGAVCHTTIPATNKTVLQYPPGTGLLLSIFPPGFQRVPLYAVASFLIFAMALAAIWTARTREMTVAATVLGAAALYFMINPAKASFSIAPTMAICAIAGYLTAKMLNGTGPRILLAAVTALPLGLSVSVRLPNLFLSAGLFMWLSIDVLKTIAFSNEVGTGSHEENPFNRKKTDSVLRLAAFAVAYLIGLSPTLVANAINAGNPLATTYGAGDAAPFDFSFSVVKDYAHDMQLWLIAAALAWAIWGLRSARGNLVSTVMIANLVVNLIFFLGHPIFTPYYLMPIAILSLWTLLWSLLLPAETHPALRVSGADLKPGAS
jgi:hypothetical protein